MDRYEFFMRYAPRFGHSRDISLLAGPTERKKEYLFGIVAFSLLLVAFYILWFILTLFFKWRGRGRYGCVAGRFFYNTEKQHKRGVICRYQTVQFFFLLFSLGIFGGSLLLVKKGLPTLGKAADEILEFMILLLSFLSEGLAVASNANTVISSLQSNSLSTYSNIEQYCSSSTVDTAQISSTLSSITSALDVLDSFIEEYKVDKLAENIEIIQTRASFVDKMAEIYVDFYWVPKMYTIIVCLMTIFILVLTVISMLRKRYKSFTAMLSYFLIPTFALLVTVGWGCLILFGAFAVMNADFCYGDGVNGPVSTIDKALIEYGLESTHILNESFQYYKSSCTVDNPWEEFFLPYNDLIQDTILNSQSFLSIDTTDCGIDFAEVIKDVIIVINDLTIFSNLFGQTLELTKCERISPIYTMLFNEEFCSSNLEGVSWTFSGLLIVTVFGLLMISFRAALYDIKVISAFLSFPTTTMSLEDDWEDFDAVRRSAYGFAVDNKMSSETRITNPSAESLDDVREIQRQSPLSQLSSRSNSTISTHEELHNEFVISLRNDRNLKPMNQSKRKGYY